MTPKVSIIIPCYNVERYVRKCVQSVLNQTLREIEIIIINDGSTDGTGKILREFADKDKRVILIEQENGGYGVAVNKGIATARGEYIGIVESDDFINPAMYEKLYAKAKERDAQVVKCNFYMYDSYAKIQNEIYQLKKHNLDIAPNGVFSPIDFKAIFYLHASIWAGIYKADFIKQIKVLETAGAAYQDFPFAMEILARASKIAVVKEAFYHYRTEFGQGNSMQVKPKKLMRHIDATLQARDALAKYSMLDKVKEEFFYNASLGNCAFFKKQNAKNRKIYADKMREVFVLYDNPQFTHFEPKLKEWTQTIMSGKTPKIPFKELRRRVFRMRIKKGEIHIKLGNFEFKKYYKKA
ncbi:glycosyltransferase [Helicobacter sp. T3_23-1056]